MNVEFTDRRLPHELQCSTIENSGDLITGAVAPLRGFEPSGTDVQSRVRLPRIQELSLAWDSDDLLQPTNRSRRRGRPARGSFGSTRLDTEPRTSVTITIWRRYSRSPKRFPTPGSACLSCHRRLESSCTFPPARRACS